MASAGDIHSILFRGDPLNASFKPRYDPSKKVKRYFPGKVPEFAIAAPPASHTGDSDEESSRGAAAAAKEAQSGDLASAISARLDAAGGSDSRGIGEVVVESARPVKRRRREVCEAAVIIKKSNGGEAGVDAPQSQQEEKKEEPHVETAAERRARLKRRALEAEQQQQRLNDQVILEAKTAGLEGSLGGSGATAGGEGSGASDDEESDSEEESDSDDGGASHQAFRPLFIPASQRISLKEKQIEADEAQQAEQARLEELEKRKQESKLILVQTLRVEEEEARRRREEEARIDSAADLAAMPDDTDDPEQEELEYEAWKVRELMRLKRDALERKEREIFEKELERRRNMTEEERREDDRRLDAQQVKGADRGKYAFLQKYYHKGAFFQDLATSGAEPLYLRDFNAAVGEDAIDKKALPKPMQLRRGQFGKVGQVKHTHLTDVDTTDYTSPWALTSKQQQQKAKMAGLKAAEQLERPSTKKR